MQKLGFWMRVTRICEGPLRTMPCAVRQQTPPGTLRETLPQKDATKRRLGELHRLLNNRKGSLSATNKKNADANDNAYDLNQKSLKALDAMANVTSEREARYVLHAATLEVAEELDRTQKNQGRLQDDLELLVRCTGRGNQRIFRLLDGRRSHRR